MEAEEYRQICSKPDSFSRGDLETTNRILIEQDASLAVLIQAILDGYPIPKPEQHQGGSDTDYFFVRLGEDIAEQVVDHLQTAEVSALGQEWETTPQATRIASLVDKWTRFIDRGKN